MVPSIRQVRSAADFRSLRDLFEQYEADLPPPLRHGAVPAVEDLMKAYDGRSAAFLATIGEGAVGCVGVRALDLRTAQLRHLFVSPRHRKLGAARALTVAAIDFARSRRYARIVLDTNKAQLGPAYVLYRSLGFSDCEPFATVSYECPTFMSLELS